MMKRRDVHRKVRSLLGPALAFFLIGGLGAKLEAQIPQIPMQGPPQRMAARQPVPLPPANPQGAAQLTPQDVNAFLDGFMPLQMQRDDIAGATIGITMNGQPLVMKGYGFADWKKKTPVDPVATTFRLASISKTFTYTAMMQQVEQGRLDLDADVNRYLDFHIQPGPDGIGDAPITLRDLATHTAGFEEELHDFGSDRSGKLPMDLGSFLKRNQPHRYARPGTKLAYSNYGVALIGYIVQRVTGEDFPAYVQKHIFGPLQMTHSSFVQPLPKGYVRSLGYLSTQKGDTGFEGFEEAPAGGLSSTAADMSRFGQMLLGGGQLDGVRVLQPASVVLLFTPQFAPAPRVAPWDLGLYPQRRNGYTFTGHGGDLIGFHSEFWVEPTHHLTFLVSYNSQRSAGVARTELFRAFVDRYLPGPAPQVKPVKFTLADLRPYAGFFSSARREDSTKMRILGLLMARRVRAHSGGYLTMSGVSDLRGTPLHFVPVGGDTFYVADEQSYIHFTRDSRGRIDGYVSPSRSDRVWLGMNPAFVGWTGGFAVLTMVLVLGAAVVRTWKRIFHRRRPRLQPVAGTRWVPWPLQLAMWGCLAVLLDVAVILGHLANYTNLALVGTLDPWFTAQTVVTGIALVLLVVGLVGGLWALGERLRWITRVKFALVMLSCGWFGWFFVVFHFVGNAHHY